jgi:hypothetical protein
MSQKLGSRLMEKGLFQRGLGSGNLRFNVPAGSAAIICHRAHRTVDRAIRWQESTSVSKPSILPVYSLAKTASVAGKTTRETA